MLQSDLCDKHGCFLCPFDFPPVRSCQHGTPSRIPLIRRRSGNATAAKTPAKRTANPEAEHCASGGGAAAVNGDQLSQRSCRQRSAQVPITVILVILVGYIGIGTAIFALWENWSIVDGAYFCFVTLSTIGFGDLVPGRRREAAATTWFCSAYIMSGMALTAMCFNVLHEELAHRVKRVVDVKARMAHGGFDGSTGIGSSGGGVGGGGGVCPMGGGGVEDPSDYLGS